MQKREATVGDPTGLYYQMAARWDLVDDILAGTQAMRNLGQERLPAAEGEDPGRYGARLARTFLHSGLDDTLKKLSSKPFSRPVHVRGDDVPDRWWSIIENVDLAGSDLTTFSHGVFASALRYGLCHTLVDFPRDPGLLADQRAGSARPYWIRIDAPDLIGWRHEKTVFGEPVLTQIRYVCDETDPDGDYGEQDVLRCRVWNAPPLQPDGTFSRKQLGTWQRYVWRESESATNSIGAARAKLAALHRTRREALEGGKWELEEEGYHGFPGIPLRTFYAKRTGLMMAEPPFEPLAVLNWEHWQSSSEQKNALAYARTPILFEAGRKSEEVTAEGEARTGGRSAPISVGAGAFHANADPESSLQYVETTGAALSEGWKDLERIEARMEKMGMQPLDERRTVARTATESAGDDEKAMSLARFWVMALERHLTDVITVSQQWAPANAADVYKLPDDFAISVFSDFGVDLRSDSARQGLFDTRKGGDLDRRTFLEEVQRRGYISEQVDLDLVEERLANESLESATVPGDFGFTDPNQPADGAAA